MFELINGSTNKVVSQHNDDDLNDAIADADYFNELTKEPFYIMNGDDYCVYRIGFVDN